MEFLSDTKNVVLANCPGREGVKRNKWVIWHLIFHRPLNIIKTTDYVTMPAYQIL